MDDQRDRVESGQHLGAHLFGKGGTARPLVDEAVGGDRDDQDVAFLAGQFQMAQMPDMEQVEDAMGEHDLASRGPVAVGLAGRLIDADQFGWADQC